ncbi:MAG: GxxExxY protein [Chitinophagales bacterium]
MEKLSENDLAKIVVQIAYEIHVKLGPGLFESVYEEILFTELTKRGLHVERQKVIYIQWDNKTLGSPAFRADLIINNKLLIEIKSVDALADLHFKQTTTYLKLTGIKLALLINFNTPLIKTGVRRIVNRL